MSTIAEELANFALSVDGSVLPAEVVVESKRILLDSLGCAVASLGDGGAEIGIRYGRVLGGGTGDASILGTGTTTSELGAAFANAELINALDQDPVLPPGHVTPYVLPGALAAGEARGGSGARLLAAIAVAHEMSYRIGKATDYLRDIKAGVVTIPAVIGYSSTIFGATAAIALMKNHSRQTVANALGIAGCTPPVNYQRAWIAHAPSTTIKYQLAGGQALAAMTAAHLAEFGHIGDLRILDDAEFGFPRFIGTSRWVPEPITRGLGSDWTFPPFQSFKPYPHCRVLHALLDALTEILEREDIRPDDIESIDAFGESFVLAPVWLNETISGPRDAQFSMAHGLAVGAHRVPPGKKWQDPEFVSSSSVLDLMKKVTYQPHPDYTAALTSNPASRRSRVEVTARGATFVGERNYPKGSPSPDPATYMSNDELCAKFRNNVSGVVADADADAIIEAVFALEEVDDIRLITGRLRPASN